MYSVSRKNCEKIAAPEKSAAAFEPESVRSLKIRSGSSGAGERSSTTGDRAPDAEREIALTTLREGRHQDGQRRRREQRRAEPLQGPERDQCRLRPREPVEERADREQEQSAHEQAPAPEQVCHA